MAWVGYNTQKELEILIQISDGMGGCGGGAFSATTKPLTLENVEAINLSTYNLINASLRVKSITVPVTDADDIKTLSLINSYLSAEIIENIRYKVLEGAGSGDGTRYGTMGRDLLKSFVNGKSFLSVNTTQSGYASKLGLADTDIADEDPAFTIDYEW